MTVNHNEEQYLDLARHVLEFGDQKGDRTGTGTKSVFGYQMRFNLQEGFPILTTKFVAFKTSVKEILWIWQKQSNDVRVLQDWNCHVWDEWMREDGTIGKAYGYQLGKYHQVDTLLETLKKDPQSRRMVVDLWNVQDLPDIICIIRILTVLQKELQSCSIPIKPVLFLIAAFIDPFVILGDQSVHFPDLEEPWLVILFDDFPGLLIDPDEYLIGTLP